jgi:iron complex transport system permease protein
MGIDVDRVRLAAFVMSGLMTAVAVSLAGLVGFVGLVIPHAVRLVWGADCRQLLPMGAIVGAAFLVVCDTVCRVIVAPAQLPVGIVTALIGGPVFIGLLVVQGRRMGPPQ